VKVSTRLPAGSSFSFCATAASAAPEEMPANRPSSRAARDELRANPLDRVRRGQVRYSALANESLVNGPDPEHVERRVLGNTEVAGCLESERLIHVREEVMLVEVWSPAVGLDVSLGL